MAGGTVSVQRFAGRRAAVVLSALLIVLLAHPARAQQYRLFDASLGAVVASNDYPGSRHTSAGFNWGFAVNATPSIRIFMEYAEQWHSSPLWYQDERLQFDERQAVVGVDWVFRQWSPHARPFVRGLFGVIGRAYQTPTYPDRPEASVLANDFGVTGGFGAGIDIPVSQRVTIRAAELDCLLSHPAHIDPEYSLIRNQLPTLRALEYNVRFAVVVVLGWGPVHAPGGGPGS